jgi:hypothetical protein
MICGTEVDFETGIYFISEIRPNMDAVHSQSAQL